MWLLFWPLFCILSSSKTQHLRKWTCFLTSGVMRERLHSAGPSWVDTSIHLFVHLFVHPFIHWSIIPTDKAVPLSKIMCWKHFLARKYSAAQGPHSEVVPRTSWRLVSKSCDECKGSFAIGWESKRWSHWTCSSLGTIFQPMTINSVPGVKCFCNKKSVLHAQSMVWHFVHHPIYDVQDPK